MQAPAKHLVLALIPGALLGAADPDRAALQAFIIRELKSLESFSYTVQAATFAPDGATFTFRRSRQGRPVKELIMPLEDVDIYAIRWRAPVGPDTFSLVVATRGREGTMIVDGVPFRGSRSIITRIGNRRKILDLERAFARLAPRAPGP